MPNTTKAALEESLKRLLLKKPLDKITITDITTDCGISRMAFIIISRIFMIWLNGPVWKMGQKPFRAKRLLSPGQKG